ncbi:hypothetical protein F4802DRAFT_271261 [Xylaria palmicola]|nr:hypothetical protein F4802DRAFT_271261 [Xylaria palmicola]
MAGRGVSRPHIRRAPLGDATDRVINASPQKPGKRSRPPNPEPNPLRAHPTGVVSTKGQAKKGTSSSPGSPIPGLKGHAAHANPGCRTSDDPRGTAPGVNTAYADNRISQISTSSGASSGNRKTHIGPWQLGKTLGKGSAARVRLARHHTTHDVVAVKILAKNMTQLTAAGSMAELDKWDRTRDEFNSQRHMPLSIEREVAVLKLIDHPHIVKLHDIWENRAEIYLVLEYMDCGDMFSYIHACGPLPEFETVGYFRQILSALEYVHSFNICHRDLKPENILMKSSGMVKIADFGMAAIQQSPTHALRTSCGSPHYAAPELITRSRYQGAKVDIWSLGCVLYVALCRQQPFDDPDGNVPKLLAKAKKGVYSVPDFVGREARDLIARMLTVDPLKRISIPKIWQHPLVRKYDDLDDLSNVVQVLGSRASDKSRPVPLEELDLQILRQLKSMWHTFSEKQIAMQLANTQPNDQKLFYWLLLGYREKQLENYDADLTYSPSDYHHLRPANWKKKFTTAEFPSRYGRTPSRFTVISTIPTDGSIEDADNVTDGGATSVSYDPYKSSRIMGNGYASQAKIVVHRNGSTANNSSRSSKSRHGRNGSIKSASTRSRLGRGGRRTMAPAAIRASRHSLTSIQSGESAPYARPASRCKRGVDFSQVRMQPAGQREVSHAPTSIAGNKMTHNAGHAPSACSVGDAKLTRDLNGRIRAGSQSVSNVPRSTRDGPRWNEEVREFSHSIARDCDDAFNSSLLDPEPYIENTSEEASISGDITLLPLGLGTPIPEISSNSVCNNAHPWDRRPLPPTPPTTASAIHELTITKNRIEEQDVRYETSVHGNSGIPRLRGATPEGVSMVMDERNLRVTSAPIYSQYSTQWGRDKIPLPSINEKSKEEVHADASDKHRTVSAPVWYARASSAKADDNPGLEFLSKQDNTIRIVDSPSARQVKEKRAPDVPNFSKHTSRGVATYSRPQQELNLRQRYMNGEPAASLVGTQEALPGNSNNLHVTKKKSSWFKRGSKDRDDVFNAVEEPPSSQADGPIYVPANAPAGPDIPPSKKKSFNLSFWRNSKNQPQMQIPPGRLDCLAPRETYVDTTTGIGVDDAPGGNQVSMLNKAVRESSKKKRVDQATTRNIEPQQNWLARLFRVKPATRYICFSISRRRARQETAILLKEWRQYGIRDVEVDKERNIVFARVGQPNCKLTTNIFPGGGVISTFRR